MPKMLTKLIPINNYNHPAGKSTCEEIAIHYTGDEGATAERLAQYYLNVAAGKFPNNPASWTSANYIVGYDGTIITCIRAGGISYAVSGENKRLINIEVCYNTSDGKFSDAAINSLAELVQRLMRAHKIPAEKVKRHYDYTRKYCPYYYVVHPEKWTELHRRITGGTAPKTYTLTARNISETQRVLIADTLDRAGVAYYTFE